MEKKVHLGNGTCGYFRPGTPALVLLHGMCGSSDHFLGAFDSSALAPFGLLAVDIPGFGDSPAVSDPPSLDRIAAALLKHETLSGDEVAALLRGDSLEEYRSAQQRLHAPADRGRRVEAGDRPASGTVQEGKPDMGLSGA